MPRSSKLSETLAHCRAIHYAMVHKQLTYTEAKKQVEPMLEYVNAELSKIAKKYNRKPKKITFSNLGSHF